MNLPRLRFKDDDGREFPEWEEKQLGDLCSTFKSGSGITSEQISDSAEYPVYGGNGLRGYTNTYTHDGFFVLIGRQGALCGNINRSRDKAYISEHAIAVNANETSNTEWLAYKLDCMKLNRLSESSAQPGLSVNKLLLLKLVVPAKPEQTKIANFLTAIDEKITQLTQKCDLLAQYKKGVMQQIFSQKLRFKDEDGREFPEWEKKTIEELVNSKIILKPLDGNHGELHPKSSDYVDIGIPFIMANDIRNNVVDIEGAKKISKTQADELQKGFSLEGDVLLTHKGSVGFVAIVPKLSTDYIMLTPQVTYYRVVNKEKLSNKFLVNYFISPGFQKEFLLLSGGGTRAYLGITEQRNLKIHIPCISEQTKIANFLTAIDDKITRTQTQLDAVKLYKKGLLQQMFV